MFTLTPSGYIDVDNGEATETAIHADFNNDGYDDLAIGSPGDNSVHVIYGSESGLTALQDDLFTGYGDFGETLAAGDFNNDGYDDLAVGRPADNEWRGSVQILYGSESGLTNYWNRVFDLDDLGGPTGTGDKYDKFGASLASADFNNDGFDDLAIGIPRDDTQARDSGSVVVAYGHGVFGFGEFLRGFENTRTSLLTQLEDRQANDLFGTSLTVGDFNNDGHEDLAVGAPGETIGSAAGAGAVNVFDGSANGFSFFFERSTVWHQDTYGIRDRSEAHDHFGQSLTTGDFDGDGRDDLAVGVPREDVPWFWSNKVDAGAVNVIYNSPQGLSSAGNQVWTQDSYGIAGTADGHRLQSCPPNSNWCGSPRSVLRHGDRFGAALIAGDFDGDGADDLAIGVAGETIDGHARAGAVNVIFGSPARLRSTGNRLLSQSDTSIPGDPEERDRFGSTLIVGDFDNDGLVDLGVGVPGDTVSGARNAGSVNVFYGSEDRRFIENQLWHKNSVGIRERAEPLDRFGS